MKRSFCILLIAVGVGGHALPAYAQNPWGAFVKKKGDTMKGDLDFADTHNITNLLKVTFSDGSSLTNAAAADLSPYAQKAASNNFTAANTFTTNYVDKLVFSSDGSSLTNAAGVDLSSYTQTNQAEIITEDWTWNQNQVNVDHGDARVYLSGVAGAAPGLYMTNGIYLGAVYLLDSGEMAIAAYTGGTGQPIQMTGSPYPVLDSTYDIGQTSKRWLNVYADFLYGDAGNITGIPGGQIDAESISSNAMEAATDAAYLLKTTSASDLTSGILSEPLIAPSIARDSENYTVLPSIGILTASYTNNIENVPVLLLEQGAVPTNFVVNIVSNNVVYYQDLWIYCTGTVFSVAQTNSAGQVVSTGTGDFAQPTVVADAWNKFAVSAVDFGGTNALIDLIHYSAHPSVAP